MGIYADYPWRCPHLFILNLQIKSVLFFAFESDKKGTELISRLNNTKENIVGNVLY